MTLQKSDIDNREKVQTLVYAFYDEVRKDELIGPIFDKVVSDWTPHLERMVSFWASTILGEGSYRGEPFPKHLALGIDKRHFERWLSLFHNTVDLHFKGEKAEEIKKRADTIGYIFSTKIEMLRTGQPE